MNTRRIGRRELRPESLMMSYGYEPRLSEGALKPPIFQTSTFVFENAHAGKAFFELAYGLRDKGPREQMGLIYSRLNNPDLEVLEDRLALWDEGDGAIAFASGMAAISTTILAFCRPGDALVHSEPLYGGTDHLLHHVLDQFGIEAVGFPAGEPVDVATIRARVGERRVGVVLVETPANPTNALVDIAEVAALARSLPGDPPLCVDNTFLGPLWQHPLKHGADLVLYSATKFIGGHSDLIAGAVVGRTPRLGPVRALRTFFGTMPDPWTGWLLLRSMETLKMRMTAQMKNARYVADFLADHPKVERVHYLGLLTEEHPQFALYRRQCLAPGSVISFDVKGGEEEAFRFLDALQLAKLAVSLGGTESLAEHPASMTHADVAPEAQRRMGIGPGMVRLSVGVEHYEDILADVQQALDAV